MSNIQPMNWRINPVTYLSSRQSSSIGKIDQVPEIGATEPLRGLLRYLIP
ncbi:MAG TPA: hypothetical protein VE226_04115 [Nitrososphaeraceae archaeon]|nr:hypothetical protein [Nitrososphaeraceae archaeon]